MHRARLALVLMAWLFGATAAHASGFSILELGGRAAGMGGAFVAIANDGSALFYNPAGIAFQKGFRMEMDGFLMKGNFRFFPSAVPRGTVVPEDGYNGVVSPRVQFLGNMFMTMGLNEKITLGLGMYSPFGLGDNWTNFKDSDPVGQKFVGRFAGTRARMENVWLQPTLAYRMSPNTSIAIGPAIVYTHLLLEQSLLNPLDDAVVFGKQVAPLIMPDQDPDLAGRSIARLLPEGRARFAGISFSPGFTAGLLAKRPQWKTNFGLMYRSPVTHHVKGNASFAFTDEYPLKAFIGADTIPNLFPRQDISATFTTPSTLSVGFANSSFWNSTLSFEFQFQDYRRFKEIPLNFSKTEGTATPPELRFKFDFHNAYFVRTGIERPLTERVTLRGGYYYDRSAVPDRTVGPFFPDSSKDVVTFGFSRKMGNKEISFFYQGARERTRTTDVIENAKLWTNGTYKVFIHLFGFGLRMTRGADIE